MHRVRENEKLTGTGAHAECTHTHTRTHRHTAWRLPRVLPGDQCHRQQPRLLEWLHRRRDHSSGCTRHASQRAEAPSTPGCRRWIRRRWPPRRKGQRQRRRAYCCVRPWHVAVEEVNKGEAGLGAWVLRFSGPKLLSGELEPGSRRKAASQPMSGMPGAGRDLNHRGALAASQCGEQMACTETSPHGNSNPHFL